MVDMISFPPQLFINPNAIESVEVDAYDDGPRTIVIRTLSGRSHYMQGNDTNIEKLVDKGLITLEE